MRSWKTTLSGIMTFIVIAWGQTQTLLDNDPVTNPEWGIVVAAFITMIGLVASRDNNITSEQAGARR